MKKIILSLYLVCNFHGLLQAQVWTEVGTGNNAIKANGVLYTLGFDKNGNLHAGGSISNFYNKGYVAIWNGTNWSELGGRNSLNNVGVLKAIAFDQNNTAYVAGFSGIGPTPIIMRYNGSIWSSMGRPTAFSIISDHATNIYFAMDDVDANRKYYIRKWNGTTFSTVGSGSNALNANFPAHALALDKSNNLYAAGDFMNTKGYRYVAKWDGTTWSELGADIDSLKANSSINSIAVDEEGNVYAAGKFTNSNGKQYVAKWNGTSWSELGEGSASLNGNGIIYSLAIDKSGNVFAAGDLYNGQAFYVAKWNGTQWLDLSKDTNNSTMNIAANRFTIYSIITDDNGNLYAAGGIIDNYSNGLPCVAKWSPSTVTSVESSSALGKLNIYPNPFKNTIEVKTDKESQLEIYNLSGTLVATMEIQTNLSTVDLSFLSPGLYTLKIHSLSDLEVIKIIKE